MRKTLLFLMLLSVKLTFGQISDDFTDGNFSINPTWSGYTSQFFVNNSKQLQSKLSANNQTVILSTPSVLALNTKWEFFIQLNFDPSTTNQARIYLIADVSDLEGPVNGYFIQIGENGSADSYDLFRQNGTVITKIIDGAAKTRLSANLLLASVRVTRSGIGKWELYTDITGGNNYNLEGSIEDLTFINTDWFGVSCKYTSTRSEGFIFDNFSIQERSPDVTNPSLISAKAIDEHTIEVVFSERLDPTLALQKHNYNLLNMGSPTTIATTNLPNVFMLTYGAILQSGTYKLTVNGVKDLSGNLIANNNSFSFLFVKPYPIKVGDLLISEVLVNPKTGGVDFIEVYNNSDQILDLKEVQLANADENGSVANIKNVSSTSIYMFPKTYWVLTTNPLLVKQNYVVKFSSQLVQMNSLPSYNNDKGSVILLGSAGQLDRLDYTEKMHFPLLQNDDGVSLERVSFTKASNDNGNFRSSAQSAGFGTPTYQNSQEEIYALKNAVSLTNQIFSPDGDGFEDQLKINYHFVSNGYLANINIYTDKGLLVRKLQRNTTIATAGDFNWDGLDDNGQQSRIGIYIIRFDAFALNGKTESFKQTCVLAAKLN
jgi:flagellar hook assembly protein FlgD